MGVQSLCLLQSLRPWVSLQWVSQWIRQQQNRQVAAAVEELWLALAKLLCRLQTSFRRTKLGSGELWLALASCVGCRFRRTKLGSGELWLALASCVGCRPVFAGPSVIRILTQVTRVQADRLDCPLSHRP